MIRDTSAQDRLVEVRPNRKRKFVLIGAGVAALAAGVFATRWVRRG